MFESDKGKSFLKLWKSWQVEDFNIVENKNARTKLIEIIKGLGFSENQIFPDSFTVEDGKKSSMTSREWSRNKRGEILRALATMLQGYCGCDPCVSEKGYRFDNGKDADHHHKFDEATGKRLYAGKYKKPLQMWCNNWSEENERQVKTLTAVHASCHKLLTSVGIEIENSGK